MRNQIKYEWTWEKMEDGDIIDSDFSDNLSDFLKLDLTGCDVGLVRNEGNDIDGLLDRTWAYIKDGKLPEHFTDEMHQPTDFKVPAKYHKEAQNFYITV